MQAVLGHVAQILPVDADRPGVVDRALGEADERGGGHGAALDDLVAAGEEDRGAVRPHAGDVHDVEAVEGHAPLGLEIDEQFDAERGVFEQHRGHGCEADRRGGARGHQL